MVGTCTGVSFFHGSNDGQKGMGLIMLILIGTVPTAYALNHDDQPGRGAELSSRPRRRRGRSWNGMCQPNTPDPDARTEVTRLHRDQATAARRRCWR